MENVASNLQAIQREIDAACLKAGREPGSVRLIAVSKTKPASLVREAFDAGQSEFGESYVQEFLQKHDDPLLDGLPLRWHFIGHLQSNKIRMVIGKVALIHGIDKISTAGELSRLAVRENLQLEYLLEVNTSEEPSKYGMHPREVLPSFKTLHALPNITLRGLMTIASPDPASAKREFRTLRILLDELKKSSPDPEKLTELSMGMSGDFEEAIAEGATMIRIGTAIFGWR
jgi:PLP dependent protein